ncbi:HIT family protein [Comamonas jiangduensis]|uniref:HIT family protein n=1 Tax=Comamonas jiangduensis TaxID=1194168 RepID=UPI001581D906|nr:HIT family protein [Comamonas jiangduensis]QXW17555.1 HIT family protein [Comamonas aquatica]
MPMFVDTSPPGHCIFCKIVAGEIPAAKVYEDDLTVAFMDIGQVNPGHVLVASKRHAVTVLDLTAEEAAAVMQTAQRIAHAAQQAFAPDGITLFQANGAAGGQTVFHFHMHVLPRHEGDGMALTWPRKEPAMPLLQQYAQQLHTALQSPLSLKNKSLQHMKNKGLR